MTEETYAGLRARIAELEIQRDQYAAEREEERARTAKEYLRAVMAEEALQLTTGQRDRLSAQLDEARDTIDRAVQNALAGRRTCQIRDPALNAQLDAAIATVTPPGRGPAQ